MHSLFGTTTRLESDFPIPPGGPRYERLVFGRDGQLIVGFNNPFTNPVLKLPASDRMRQQFGSLLAGSVPTMSGGLGPAPAPMRATALVTEMVGGLPNAGAVGGQVSDGSAWVTHPWVAEGVQGVRFGVMGGERRGDWLALLDWAQTVEDLGFDSYWINDHTTLSWRDCWTALTALAVKTSRVRLGSMVSCVYYRPPALLARMAAGHRHWHAAMDGSARGAWNAARDTHISQPTSP